MAKSDLTNDELQGDARELIEEVHRRVDADPGLPPRIRRLAKLFHYAAEELERGLHQARQISALSIGGEKD